MTDSGELLSLLAAEIEAKCTGPGASWFLSAVEDLRVGKAGSLDAALNPTRQGEMSLGWRYREHLKDVALRQAWQLVAPADTVDDERSRCWNRPSMNSSATSGHATTPPDTVDDLQGSLFAAFSTGQSIPRQSRSLLIRYGCRSRTNFAMLLHTR